jgi:hypothetical protein
MDPGYAVAVFAMLFLVVLFALWRRLAVLLELRGFGFRARLEVNGREQEESQQAKAGGKTVGITSE